MNREGDKIAIPSRKWTTLLKHEQSFYAFAMVEYIARKKFKPRRKCYFEEDKILNENLNENLPDLK